MKIMKQSTKQKDYQESLYYFDRDKCPICKGGISQSVTIYNTKICLECELLFNHDRERQFFRIENISTNREVGNKMADEKLTFWKPEDEEYEKRIEEIEKKRERQFTITFSGIKRIIKRALIVFGLIVLFYSGTLIASAILDILVFASYYLYEFGMQMWLEVLYQLSYTIPTYDVPLLLDHWIPIYFSSSPIIWKLIVLTVTSIITWFLILVILVCIACGCDG